MNEQSGLYRGAGPVSPPDQEHRGADREQLTEVQRNLIGTMASGLLRNVQIAKDLDMDEDEVALGIDGLYERYGVTLDRDYRGKRFETVVQAVEAGDIELGALIPEDFDSLEFLELLTKRQKQILALMTIDSGRQSSLDQIGGQLGIWKAGVGVSLGDLYRKQGGSTQIQTALRFMYARRLEEQSLSIDEVDNRPTQ